MVSHSEHVSAVTFAKERLRLCLGLLVCLQKNYALICGGIFVKFQQGIMGLKIRNIQLNHESSDLVPSRNLFSLPISLQSMLSPWPMRCLHCLSLISTLLIISSNNINVHCETFPYYSAGIDMGKATEENVNIGWPLTLLCVITDHPGHRSVCLNAFWMFVLSHVFMHPASSY